MTVPTSPPAGWYADPDGSAGQRYWDGGQWTSHRRTGVGRHAGSWRQRWVQVPAVLRLVIPIALALTVIGVGFAIWTKPTLDSWARLPKRLTCQTQDGPKPPPNITVSSVDVRHPRGGVLELVVRFAQPLPPSPTGTRATGFVGYILNYSIANNGTKFVELGPEQDTDDLAINGTLVGNSGEASMRPDRDTNARRTAPDTVQIFLELNRLGVPEQAVNPQLTLNAQFNTPSTTTVRYAAQTCRG
ncbi:membrane protein [Mycobacterium kubicae]|uniref:DUF2510 domain-containing protein n=1 Tax=Mycobacterium kubicae TaxID=120959 RepID=A0AAX1J7V9_9MYCO|nr:DUF2510 domain-containing protein [Mycobacterium kubicae]MCV7094496.1 DUF2510 domain-containing protein [Mycobacterium kubicae]QPI37536.1 DUF2510 domain-containing protein [Mycobacterium kubicae]GFG66185.1 membrane protein [Mycobacterium kubicae]